MSTKRRVEIIAKSKVDKNFFQIEEARLRYERYDGTMAEEVVRLNLRRGDSVAAVVHDPANDTVILVEQFRYPTYENGPGWLLELPAGTIEHHDDPAETLRRELLEEIGYIAVSVQPIQAFYLSPGGSSERLYLYYTLVASQDQTARGGGLEEEHEDIRIITLKTQDALARLHAGEINDAKTIVGLQWLQWHLTHAAR
jgi:nudix-type nucleoside diphosphatase (YffH/AdpP family)